jgi:hypothetical protein
MQVVALDLAGQETGQRNAAHKEAFSLAHRKFMNKTVRRSPVGHPAASPSLRFRATHTTSAVHVVAAVAVNSSKLGPLIPGGGCDVVGCIAP